MKQIRIIYVLMVGLAGWGCTDIDALETELDGLEERIGIMEESSHDINSNSIALKTILDGKTVIVGYNENVSPEGTVTGYSLEFSDGQTLEILFGKNIRGNAPIVSINENRLWTISLDGGDTFNIIEDGITADGSTPLVCVDENGYWCVSLDDGASYNRITGTDGKPISAVNGAVITGQASVFKDVVYDSEQEVMIFTILETGETVSVPVHNDFYIDVIGLENRKDVIMLSETRKFEVEISGVEDAWIQVPPGWEAILEDNLFTVIGPSSGTAGDYDVNVVIFSAEKYTRKYTYTFTLNPVTLDGTACTEWNEFISGSPDNVLLDFSYAGYGHGELPPPDAYSLGYDIYDVTDFGAVPDDGKSDREAFLKAVSAALGTEYENVGDNDITFRPNANARAIVYFPEGEYILHTSDDNIDVDEKELTQTIRIRAGEFILKGAGRDRTTLVMQDAAQPRSEDLFSSPPMIEIKHNTNFEALTTVTSDAGKGSYSVDVASTAGIAPGTWVCLWLQNNDPELVAREVAPYEVLSDMTDIIQNGVKVVDLHQVRSVDGNTVTFCEPIMHEVEAEWGWKIRKYSHYANIGVEDLTFKGNAKEEFSHHASWEDDGAFKPINMMRCVNSWMRRVNFISVSECTSFVDCANISAYDIDISGNRGHAAIRADESSRVFIGAVTDHSSGDMCGTGPVLSGQYMENAGQFHASGVSGASMGTVLWRNIWGDDSCFEAHASQPRATLVDCCTGGFMRNRAGGSLSALPNHLADLTLWNLHATSANPAGSDNGILADWIWWSDDNFSWKILPPVIVGFQSGFNITFNQDQAARISSQGMAVSPESLYEAQLRRRLGYVPAWLNSLK